MTWKFLLFVCLISAVTISSVFLGHSNNPYGYLEAGGLVILAITLVVIARYAWDTHRIANATEQKWEEELKPRLYYEMYVDPSEKQSDRVAFRLINPTDYIIDASVNCNFKIYGETMRYAGAYDGTETWVVYPHQISQGLFKVDELLAKKGKSREQMIKEKNQSNSMEQLTMDLEITFKSETGRTGKYPSRHHYFDFERWIWVPFLTKL